MAPRSDAGAYRSLQPQPWRRCGRTPRRQWVLALQQTLRPVARLKPTGEDGKVRVLAWHREKWGASGPFGVPTMTLDRALDYVASNPFFWIHV